MRVTADKFSVLRQKSATKRCSITKKCRIYTVDEEKCGVCAKKLDWSQHTQPHPLVSYHILSLLQQLVTTKLLHV